jgi:hypothetical protein
VRARLRLLASAACAGLCALSVQSCGEDDSVGPAPPRFVGIVSADLYANDHDYRERMLKRQRAAGIGLIRQAFNWNEIEKTPGRFDFKRYDGYVGELARHNVAVLPILFAPPSFRSAKPAHGGARGTYPPRRPIEMAVFARLLVDRYGPKGSFWRKHPDVPRMPIRAWQVWNEPNLPVYWPSGPDPTGYARLLATVRRGLKTADPHAVVVSAGLSNSRLGIPFREYVTGMYRAGAARSIDVFGLHPFARNAQGVLGAVEGTRTLLRQLHGPTPIWVTEFAWASSGPPSPFTYDERGQADRIREALLLLGKRRRELGLRGVVYYDWRDSGGYPGGQDFFGLHTGLLDARGRNKPALRAFQSVAAHF